MQKVYRKSSFFWQHIALIIAGIGVLGILIATYVIATFTANAATNTLSWQMYYAVKADGPGLITLWENEAQGAVDRHSYNSYKPFFYASRTQADGLAPVYRMHKKNNDFVFVSKESDVNAAKADGYSISGSTASFYAYASDNTETEPVYQYVKNGFHRYALTPEERSSLVSQGYTQEKIVFYARPQQPFQTEPDLGPSVLKHEIYLAVKNNGPGLLAQWENEASTAVSKYGYTEYSPAFYASRTQAEGLLPVYQLSGPKNTFFATISVAEKDDYIANKGFGLKGISFYASSVKTSQTEPVYRYVKNGFYRYAVTAEARATYEANGYASEGAIFYVRPLVPLDDDNPGPVDPIPTHPGDGDSVFSIAVMPDTQQETMTFSQNQFQSRTNAIVSKKESQDIRFIGHTGDVVSAGVNADDTSQHYQLDIASEAFETVDNSEVPYLIAIGNHDTGAVCGGGSACPGGNTRVGIRDTARFNQFFSTTRLGLSSSQVFEQGKIDNSYKTFTAEGKNWLVLSLEMYPRVAAVEWAKGVVEDHPKHNVIVLNHYTINGDGSIVTSAGYGETSPRWVYDNFFLKYSNIKLIFSGHVGNAASRTDTGVHGNKVATLLATFHQNDYNPTRYLTINTETSTISSVIEAATIRPAYKAKYPDATLPSYAQYNVTISGLSFVSP